MSRLTIYVIKEISSSFLFNLILLSGILWLGQGLRHLDLLTTDNVQVSSYFSYVLLLLPKILQLTTPFALFISILFTINRLRSDSELIVLWASGRSNRNILLKPIFLFTIFIFLFLITLSVYITPYSLNEIRHKIVDIRSSGIHVGILKERKFVSPVNTLTIFLQEIDGDKISGLLIHDLKNPNTPSTYIAENGEFIYDNNKRILRLYNGSVQILNKEDKKISEIAFEIYDLNLAPYNKQEASYLYADELTTSIIISKIRSGNFDKAQFAEINNRFINPLYIFCIAFLPLLMFKLSRRPDDNWLLPIFFVSICGFIIKITEIALSNILIDNNSFFIFNLLFPLLITSIILLFLYIENSRIDRIRDVFQT